MKKRALTDRVIRALKRGGGWRALRRLGHDHPKFGVRVMNADVKSFILIARYAGPRANPTRRSLGRVGQIRSTMPARKAGAGST